MRVSRAWVVFQKRSGSDGEWHLVLHGLFVLCLEGSLPFASCFVGLL